MWRCKSGCSECCICYGMSSDFVERFRRKATVPIIKEVVRKGRTTLVTEDGFCFLLNRETHKCTVYKDRPYVCHLFGRNREMPCPYVSLDGTFRHEYESEAIKESQKY